MGPAGRGRTWYRRSEYPFLAPNFPNASSITCLAVTAKYEPITTAEPITCHCCPGSSTTTLSAISWIGSVGGETRKNGIGGSLCGTERSCHILRRGDVPP